MAPTRQGGRTRYCKEQKTTAEIGTPPTTLGAWRLVDSIASFEAPVHPAAGGQGVCCRGDGRCCLSLPDVVVVVVVIIVIVRISIVLEHGIDCAGVDSRSSTCQLPQAGTVGVFWTGGPSTTSSAHLPGVHSGRNNQFA